MSRHSLAAMLAIIPLAAALHAAPDDRKPAHGKNAATPASQQVMRFGKGKFKAPETVVWDEREDVYLVSNVNGKLTARDDNGFISRVAPDGSIRELKWIDGASGPDVMLHGPKDMLLSDRHLIVADVGAVRWFDRESGKPIRAVTVPDAHMLNALAFGPDEDTVYVSDTGGKTDDKPGAIYRIGKDNKPKKIAGGPELDRPNGIAWRDEGLVVAPFGQHADQLYHLSLAGEKKPLVTLPGSQLDGLLRLGDGTMFVTSWKGEAVYEIDGQQVRKVAGDVKKPAQIGYDRKRERLLVPAAKRNEVLVYAVSADK